MPHRDGLRLTLKSNKYRCFMQSLRSTWQHITASKLWSWHVVYACMNAYCNNYNASQLYCAQNYVHESRRYEYEVQPHSLQSIRWIYAVYVYQFSSQKGSIKALNVNISHNYLIDYNTGFIIDLYHYHNILYHTKK